MDISKIEKVLKENTMIYKLRSKIIENKKVQVIIEIKLGKDKVTSLLSKIQALKDVTYSKIVSYEGDLEEG
jgi:hypothetical protein